MSNRKTFDLKLDTGYINWLKNVKSLVQSTRSKAMLSANASLIELYWQLGKAIFLEQQQSQWGDKVIDQLAKDLKEAFPESKGFSNSNLKYAKRFYQFYQNAEIGQQAVDQLENVNSEIVQQAVAQIPWGHNILIFTKSKNTEEANFYIRKTIENQWSREALAFNIKNKLISRQGDLPNNFEQTLPVTQSELAKETFKDPYIFDFLQLTERSKEKDIEDQLVQNVTKCLLELGKGFAFVSRQYHLTVAHKDYYIDLLFYHIHLKCYVVIELKNTSFQPEYAGKLNFYLSAVDDSLKTNEDQPTIGILLCREKNNIEVEFALRGMSQPMGVSEIELTDVLPDQLKSSMPSIEELENQLSQP